MTEGLSSIGKEFKFFFFLIREFFLQFLKYSRIDPVRRHSSENNRAHGCLTSVIEREVLNNSNPFGQLKTFQNEMIFK